MVRGAECARGDCSCHFNLASNLCFLPHCDAVSAMVKQLKTNHLPTSEAVLSLFNGASLMNLPSVVPAFLYTLSAIVFVVVVSRGHLVVEEARSCWRALVFRWCTLPILIGQRLAIVAIGTVYPGTVSGCAALGYLASGDRLARWERRLSELLSLPLFKVALIFSGDRSLIYVFSIAHSRNPASGDPLYAAGEDVRAFAKDHPGDTQWATGRASSAGSFPEEWCNSRV